MLVDDEFDLPIEGELDLHNDLVVILGRAGVVGVLADSASVNRLKVCLARGYSYQAHVRRDGHATVVDYRPGE